MKARRDIRLRALAGLIVGIACVGVGITWVGNDPGAPASVPAVVPRNPQQAEFDTRFKQAVVMLHAKQYEHAVTALHRLLEIAPEVPEVHVNMGFALLGLKRFAAARDFFRVATDLRTTQVNAYYGLAVASEALGDRPAALGAMRTYVHLTVPDDPWLPKARAALWEWQSAPEGAAR